MARARGPRAAAAVAGALLAALALAGGALAAHDGVELPPECGICQCVQCTAEECASLKKRACRASPFCKWGGRGDRAAPGARCALAVNVCDGMQRRRNKRYWCKKQAAECRCSQKKGKRCGACTTRLPTEDKLKEGFRVLDKDGNGFISSDDLRLLITNPSSDLVDLEVDEIIRDTDIDGDGQINYEEFVNCVTDSDARPNLVLDARCPLLR